MAEVEKTILTVPELPAVVKGDGRYVMSLLRQFLRETATQVNLANGFTAEELKPSSNVQTPKNFFLSFDRTGARFTWDHIKKIDTLFYYELRTDQNLGSSNGLLERTIENESVKLPVSYSAEVYLYAITKDGEASAPAKISYTKPRPEEPEDLALTKSSEGTLITFLEIPSNCIGANVYVNGRCYVVYDNIFLYQDSEKILVVEVAYFDSFGEGQRATLVAHVPDITGFWVDRNGDSLDFYWDELSIHGIQYVVRCGETPVWETSFEIFRTKTNKKKYIFPRTGTFYFLIKGLSEQNVYSDNAAWVSTVSVIDIHNNVILSFDQGEIAYSGAKINMYYNAVQNTLALDRNVFYGEYMINASLDQRYLARNWVDYRAAALSVDSVIWDEAVFTWDSTEAERVRWAGASTSVDAEVCTEIATKLDESELPSNLIDNFSLNNTTVSDRSDEAEETQNIGDYAPCRWGNGLFIGNNTRLSYQSLDFPAEYSLTFNVKTTSRLRECVFLTLCSDSGWLAIGHSGDVIYVRDNTDNYITIVVGVFERDWLTLGISQEESTRTLFVKSLAQDKIMSKKENLPSIGSINGVYFYPNMGGT